MSNSGLQSSSSDSRKSDSRNSDSRNAEMDQAIVEYMQACETGQFPDKQALLKKYARRRPALHRDAMPVGTTDQRDTLTDLSTTTMAESLARSEVLNGTIQVLVKFTVTSRSIRQTVLAGPTRRQCCTQRLAATSLR